jgi:tetratricopeptide (TPR) repeat protein
MSPSRLSLIAFLAFTFALHAQTPSQLSEQAQQHRDPVWLQIEAHLPDPHTASAADLETAADVLRARRFDYDALDFYRHAIDRGGDPARLLNRIGILELGLHQSALALACFRRSATLQPKDPQYRNNAAAAEFLAGDLQAALHDYKRALKLQKNNAIFHANLATVYFALQDYESTRKQVDLALRLDPDLYKRQDASGTEARVISSTDRGRFCFELARSAARRQDDPSVISWLTKSADANFDIQTALANDSSFHLYRKDPRVLTLIQNTRALHAHHTLVAAAIPPLPDSVQPD